MGRGLEDFSHLFLSQEVKGEITTPRRVVSFFSSPEGVERPFLLANLALALTHKGREVGIIEADLQFPPIAHLLGQFHPQIDSLPLLLPPSLSLLQRIEEMGREKEIILINASQFTSPLTQIILKLIDQAIIILPVELPGRVNGYQLIKSIHLFRKEIKLGLLITKACTAQEARTTYEGITAIAKKHLGIELENYGFLLNDLHIPRSIREGRPPSLTSHSRLGRSIRDIADLIEEGKGGGDNNFCARLKLSLKDLKLESQG